jgi:hypothetical protein
VRHLSSGDHGFDVLFRTPCEDPAPLSQGYWHRQCLGADLIDPGRNGRGPQEPLEPNFDKLETDVSLRLQSAGLPVFFACSDGMDADPASDPCQRATKQLTALLFNLESGGLTPFCEVDLSAQGCVSTNAGDLVNEVANLIIGGNCQQAADCAGAVNESLASESLALPSGTNPDFGGLEPTATFAKPNNPGRAAIRTLPRRDTATQPVQPADSTRTPVAVFDGARAVRSAEGADADADRTEPAAPMDENPVEAIERHLMILANGSSLQEHLGTSTAALLTALSGGYELELRLQIVKGLLGKVDVAYESLLAEHLRHIRDEAVDFGKEDLAKEAEKLLKHLEPAEQ